MGVVHKVRSFEVTYGDNGWHPHFHILMFNKYILVSADLRKNLSELWIKACVRAGLSAPSMKHGLDLRDGEYASEYVSKWGIEHELTKGHIKRESTTVLHLLISCSYQLRILMFFKKSPQNFFRNLQFL